LEDQRDYFYTILEKNTATEEHVNDKIGWAASNIEQTVHRKSALRQLNAMIQWHMTIKWQLMKLSTSRPQQTCWQTGLTWRLMKPAFNATMSSRSPAVRKRSWDPALRRRVSALNIRGWRGWRDECHSCQASYQLLVTFYFIKFYL
jgi:hypothetical protein